MTALTDNLTPEPAQTTMQQFDRGYKWLHWIMAALIFLMFMAIQGFATAITDEDRMTMLLGHSSMGTIITMLLIVRITKRFVKRDPKPVQNIPRWQQLASSAVQMGLYFCMVFIPVTGYLTARAHELPVMVFGSFNLSQSAQSGYQQSTFETLRQVHEFGISLIMVLLVVHIGAVIYHRMIKKDDVLASMTRGKK